jgi:hypothetical protein
LAGVRFSLARYSVIVYTAAAMLVLSLATYAISIKRRTALSLLLMIPTVVAGGLGLRHIYSDEPTQSLSWFIGQRSEMESYPEMIDTALPENAILYVRFRDKYVWSSRTVGLLPTEPGPAKRDIEYETLIGSLDKALDSGFIPYLTELTSEEVDDLDEFLEVSGLTLQSELAGSWQVWQVAPVGSSG